MEVEDKTFGNIVLLYKSVWGFFLKFSLCCEIIDQMKLCEKFREKNCYYFGRTDN